MVFGEEPECLFGALGTRVVTVKHKVYSIDTKLSGEAGDLFSLWFCHAVGHDTEGWNTEIVEVDHVVKTFNEDQAVLLDEFAVARFLQTAGLLAVQFEATMEAFGEPMFSGWFFAGAFSRGELLVFSFFLFVLNIASDPCQNFALLGEHGVEDAAAE